MNNSDRTVFEYITELVSLLTNDFYPSTVKTIARKTGKTLQQTCCDLDRLKELNFKITLLNYEEETADFKFSDGNYDDEELLIDMSFSNNNEGALLLLDATDQDLFTKHLIKDLYIKKSPVSNPDAVYDRVKVIEEAIKSNSYVSFRYRDETGKIESIHVFPRILYHNTTDDLYYCIAFGENSDMSIKAFRIDRILYDINLLSKEKSVPLNKDDPRYEYMQNVWGSDFANESNPVHVKIEILPNTSNIMRKIQADTVDRTHKTIVKSGNTYIYEDDVIGLTSFRSWLMKFGSSVKVIEPQSLASDILKSSKRRLENYTDGYFHDMNFTR